MHHLRQTIRWLAVALAGACAGQVLAEVSAEEARQLGGPLLTQWGAEKAGNKEGTIPPYTGSGIKAPPGWNPKNPGQRPDPYGEKPLFTITARNAAQYADKLDGMIEMFKQYPDFRMDVYPSHRDWVFPQYMLDNTVKNATACKAVDQELKLEGCFSGLPFPIPKTGNQAMWNHLVNYQAWSMKGKAENWVVPASGDALLVERGEFLYNWPYYDPAKTEPHAADALYYRFLGKDDAPPRLAGGQMLLHDAVDQLNIGRKAWLYLPGRRWTKLAAELAYDTPNPYTGGTATMDDAWVFIGALDRYDFKLVGKKEKFIYYNTFHLANNDTCPREKLTATKHFPNPDCVRWELHRVYVVEATLKPGAQHIYKRRVFYWDEDGFASGQAESYDASGKLFRVNNALSYPFHEAPGGLAGANVYMDLKSGIYTTTGLATCPDCGWWPVQTRISELVFSPEAMSGSGLR